MHQKQPGGRAKKLRKPLHVWSKDDVTKWLKVYQSDYYQQYKEIFDYHELTGERPFLDISSACSTNLSKWNFEEFETYAHLKTLTFL